MLPSNVLEAMEDRIINEVPGEPGFKTSSAENAYLRVGLKLLDGGHHADDIINMLSSLYWCASLDFRL